LASIFGLHRKERAGGTASLPMDTNILLIKPLSYLQKAKRNELAEFCCSHDLVVGCTRRRGQSVKPDFVDAIWAYVSVAKLDVLPVFDHQSQETTLHQQQWHDRRSYS
jgi:hypothetical protein